MTNLRPWKGFWDLKLNTIVNNAGEVSTVEIPNIRFVEDFGMLYFDKTAAAIVKEIGILSDSDWKDH